MDVVEKHLKAAQKKYDANEDASPFIKLAAEQCIRLLRSTTQSEWNGPGGKTYIIFATESNQSRPFLSKYLTTSEAFSADWDLLIRSGDRSTHRFTLTEEQVNKTLYNIVVPFCVCYDLWKPKSRKTPGTFFEVVLGTLISMILPGSTKRTKHIPLPIKIDSKIVENSADSAVLNLKEQPELELMLDEESFEDTDFEEGTGQQTKAKKSKSSQIATDIVFDWKGKGIVIPAKITTRERIVQPFAHQRILDSIFDEGRYISLLVCVSETQRSDADKKVNEICVPGTITLFQKHLAKIRGIYYLDPPQRYMILSSLDVIQVSSLGFLLVEGLSQILDDLQISDSEK